MREVQTVKRSTPWRRLTVLSRRPVVSVSSDTREDIRALFAGSRYDWSLETRAIIDGSERSINNHLPGGRATWQWRVADRTFPFPFPPPTTASVGTGKQRRRSRTTWHGVDIKRRRRCDFVQMFISPASCAKVTSPLHRHCRLVRHPTPDTRPLTLSACGRTSTVYLWLVPFDWCLFCNFIQQPFAFLSCIQNNVDFNFLNKVLYVERVIHVCFTTWRRTRNVLRVRQNKLCWYIFLSLRYFV